MNRLPADSLAFRVIVLSSLWAVAALFVVGGLISTLYGRTATKGFQDLLDAQLFNLVASVAADEDGSLKGSPNLGDLRYSRPQSGWYWEAVPASDNTTGRLRSISLGNGVVEPASTAEVPFSLQYRRSYDAEGLKGEELRVAETEVVLDSQNHTARFRVMGNQSAIQADIDAFNRQLAFYLGLVGLGSVLINAGAILVGLRPLRRVRQALGDVRAGRAQRLTGRFPAEIEPLAREVNLLIDSNRRIVERSRKEVGNLAHSLRTPIAVLMNEATTIGGTEGRLVAEQSERMRMQVQHYLDRARLAAQTETSVFRTPMEPTLERVARVIAKLNPQLDVRFRREAKDPTVFLGEAQDLEEVVGNLMENAAKFARKEIRLTLAPDGPDRVIVSVEDDGPGLTAEEMVRAVKRGQRLDERVPGSGLGLSIVADTVEEYRGTLELARSDLGGLKAEVRLPRAGQGALS